MGVICYDSEIASAIPAGKLFKAFVLDSDNLIPKLMPQAIKSVELVSGNGGPGSIKQVNFGEGSQLKCVKHRIDGIDTEKLTYSYTLIEGDILKDKIESISYEVKIESSSDGGSICKSTSKYHTIGDYDIKEEEIKAGKDKATGLFKAVEAYLLANPDAYN